MAVVCNVRACWSLDEVVSSIEALPTSTPLPVRTVLVPNARIGRGLRHRLLTGGHERLLAGTRFFSPAVLADAVLRRAGIQVRIGEGELREHRIAQIIAEGIDPPGFGQALLRETIGWASAFAATIGDLERADLRPADLGRDDVLIAGLRSVWEAADLAAGTVWTHSRALGEAGRLLAADASLLRDCEAVLAVTTLDVDPVVASFVGAIPGATVALLAARPLRVQAIDRAIALFGPAIRDPLLHGHPTCRDGTDLGIAAAHLFELERTLASPERPRAKPDPDGSLTLEEFDGVAAEIDAAVGWVCSRIRDGIPLDRMAVLAPSADPWSSLLTAQLRSVGNEEELPIDVDGGLPLAHTAAGARVHAVLRALAGHLGADVLVDALCGLRSDDPQGRRPSRARVFDLVFSLGTRGGSRANPSGAFEWRVKLDHAEARLSIPVEMAGFVDQAEHVARRHARRLETLQALRRAIVGLCTLAERIADGATLSELRPMLVGFIREHVVQPTEGARIHSLLDDRLELLASDPTCARICGTAVVDLVVGLLSSIRIASEAPERAALYVGTVASAAGMSFDAVRIVGLSEGSIPSTVRGDPVLPDELRAQLSPWLTCGADRALASLHRFDLVVRGTAKMLALSAPRLAVDRTVREPSSVFLEVGAALGRAGADAPAVPSLDALRRTDIGPALARAELLRTAQPGRPTDWHDRLAAGHAEVPRRWHASPALDLLALTASMPTPDAWHPMDGVFDVPPAAEVVGLDPSRPTSAWRLSVLLQCPHRFLYEHVLGWEEPIAAPPGHDLDPMTFGDLVHTIAERFFRLHGDAFEQCTGDLTQWREVGRAIAREELDALLATHGLDSTDASAAVHRKLRIHVDRLLEQGWSKGPRRFLAAELAFGFETAARLVVDGGELFVRGRIDLIDATEAGTMVHDIKTGACTPRQGRNVDASPAIDLQIGLYANIVGQLELGSGASVGGSYIHTNDRRGTERAFVGTDGEVLRRSALEWLATAHALLAARTFPRTPHHGDCSYCQFKPVCGDAARVRGDELLQRTTVPALVRFRTLKATP